MGVLVAIIDKISELKKCFVTWEKPLLTTRQTIMYKTQQ